LVISGAATDVDCMGFYSILFLISFGFHLVPFFSRPFLSKMFFDFYSILSLLYLYFLFISSSFLPYSSFSGCGSHRLNLSITWLASISLAPSFLLLSRLIGWSVGRHVSCDFVWSLLASSPTFYFFLLNHFRYFFSLCWNNESHQLLLFFCFPWSFLRLSLVARARLLLFDSLFYLLLLRRRRVLLSCSSLATLVCLAFGPGGSILGCWILDARFYLLSFATVCPKRKRNENEYAQRQRFINEQTNTTQTNLNVLTDPNTNYGILESDYAYVCARRRRPSFFSGRSVRTSLAPGFP